MEALQAEVESLRAERARLLDAARDAQLSQQALIRLRVQEAVAVARLASELRVEQLEQQLHQALTDPSPHDAESSASPSFLALQAQLQSKTMECLQLRARLAVYESAAAPPPHRRHATPSPRSGLMHSPPFSPPAPLHPLMPASPASASPSSEPLRTLTLRMRVAQLPAALLAPSDLPRYLLLAVFVRSVSSGAHGATTSAFHYCAQSERHEIDSATGDELTFDKTISLKSFQSTSPTELLFSLYSSLGEDTGDTNREKVGSAHVQTYALLSAVPEAGSALSPPSLASLPHDSDGGGSDSDQEGPTSRSAMRGKLSLELLIKHEHDREAECSNRELAVNLLNDRHELVGGGLTRLVISAAITPLLTAHSLPPAPPSRTPSRTPSRSGSRSLNSGASLHAQLSVSASPSAVATPTGRHNGFW